MEDDDTSLVLNFGGFNIAVKITNHLINVGNGQCILGITPTESESGALGDVFLVDAYVLYDLDSYEFSLAQASYNTGIPEDVKAIRITDPSATRARLFTNVHSFSQYYFREKNIH